MDVFYTGLLTMAGVLGLFYVVFFGFVYYWHLKKTTFVVLPIMFVFKLVVECFLIVSAVAMLFYWAPIIINYFGL